MHATFLLEGMDARGTAAALVWRDETYGYDWLARRTRDWGKRLADEGIGAGNVVALEADFSPNAVALFLALTDVGAVCVSLTSSVAQERTNFLAIADVERTAHIHAILGQMVCARVTPTPDATLEGLAARIKKHCRTLLAGFKVPAKVEISHEEQHSARFKKLRPKEARDDGGAS